jgi:phosphoserine phosphatase RsbU/P
VPLSKTRVDLGALVEQVLRDVRHQTTRELALHVELDTPITGDADRMNRLVDNLVGNALRHGDGPVTVRIARDGERAALSVHNGGTPIAPEQLGTLFDPFTRAGGSKGGFGLGLYIVDQITRAHGGTVSVSSSRDDGTLFTIKLPIE